MASIIHFLQLKIEAFPVLGTLLVVVSLLNLVGCSVDGVNTDQESPKLRWASQLGDQSVLYGTIRPLISASSVITSRSNFSLSTKDPLIGYNLHTGDLKWTWDEHLFSSEFFKSNDYRHIYNDVLAIASSSGAVYGINTETGETIWSSHQQINHGADVTGYEDIIFNVERREDGASIYKSSLNEGVWEEVFALELSGNKYPRIYAPNIVKLEQEDLLLVFRVNWYDLVDFTTEPYLYVFNLKLRQTLTTVKLAGNDNIVGGIREIPTIYNSRVFVVLDDEIICIDLISGEILWRKVFSYSKLGGHTFADGDYVVASSLDGYLTLFDSGTGQTQWKKYVGGGSEIYGLDGILYTVGFSDHHLYALDVASGSYIWDYQSPIEDMIPGAFFQDLIGFDTDTRRMFICNYISIASYELLNY